MGVTMRYAIGCALALIFSAPCAAAMAPAKDVPKKGRSHAAPKAAQQDTLASIDYSKIVTREIQRELKEQATAPKSAVAAALERSEERRVGKSVSVRVDLGGRRIIKKKKENNTIRNISETSRNK